MSKANKVEVQKGAINPSVRTSKMQTHLENVAQAREQSALRRSGQTLTMHEPKTGRK